MFLCFPFLTTSAQTDVRHNLHGRLRKIFFNSLLLLIFCFSCLLSSSLILLLLLKCPFCCISSLSSNDHIFSIRYSLLVIHPFSCIHVLAALAYSNINHCDHLLTQTRPGYVAQVSPLIIKCLTKLSTK